MLENTRDTHVSRDDRPVIRMSSTVVKKSGFDSMNIAMTRIGMRWAASAVAVLAATLAAIWFGRSGPMQATYVVARASAVPASSDTSFYATAFERRPDAAKLTALGRQLFSEPALSASGRMSCASCHDPAHAYAPANARAVQTGGVALQTPGLRAVPSLMYAQDAPPFSEHFSDTDGDDSVDQGPTGGRGWDGRASSAHEQAAIPLLSPFEMANADVADVVRRLRGSASAAAFRAAFGENVFADEGKTWTGLLWSLEVFQQSPTDFYPYTSKYDASLRGQASLGTDERRGLEAFNDPRRGNCAQCHPSGVKRGAFPQFTDRGLVAIGVPRNASIAANADPAFHDLGLCGPLRHDLSAHPQYCGRFKTPTLRNVATRQAFFHNGVFHRLEAVIDFYADRDVHPERFYKRGRAGTARSFDDLIGSQALNVNADPPFGRRAKGAPSPLDRRGRADLLAFLKTLTDGYRPGPAEPASAAMPAKSRSVASSVER